MKKQSLTTTEAFEKYFGKISEMHKTSYPFKCSCGEYSLMHLDDNWIGHLRHKHGERITNRKPKEEHGQ